MLYRINDMRHCRQHCQRAGRLSAKQSGGKTAKVDDNVSSYLWREESMRVLDAIALDSLGRKSRIELCQGDLTSMPKEDNIDLLVVSAFPDDYVPTPLSLIGALARKGISVRSLAQNKAVDLRPAFSCWLSNELTPKLPGIPYKRILCFEPGVRGRPPEVVGDIFRSLAPFLTGPPRSILWLCR
jgi:hypothetical protein